MKIEVTGAEPSTTVMTRSGKQVRIYAIEHGQSDDDAYTIHGAFQPRQGVWCSISWRHDGKYSRSRDYKSEFDLISRT